MAGICFWIPKQIVDAHMLLPVQDDAEDAEVKEKREGARARHRAWRKVLLDGLDLVSELTRAASNASPGDEELEQDCQVSFHTTAAAVLGQHPAGPVICFQLILQGLG